MDSRWMDVFQLGRTLHFLLFLKLFYCHSHSSSCKLWPVQLNEHSQIERDPVHYFITHLHNPGGEYKVTAEKKGKCLCPGRRGAWVWYYAWLCPQDV